MLRLSVATNWDDELIKEIAIRDPEHKVTEIFGKLASDFVGGGRPAYAINAVSKKQASRHIKSVKGIGREFNYLLNASCMDNREFTRAGQKHIRQLLSWLGSIGVDIITVTNPYLGYLIKKEYPQFELCVSAHAHIDSVRKAQFWVDDMGVNKITLSPRINRDPPLLKKIRSNIDRELQLLANEPCLYDCPFVYHSVFVAHASQSHHLLKGYGIDWCLINCRHKLLTQPEELIKASWIRPEDASYYENIGINSLKIIDRGRETKHMVFTLEAYLKRKFEGNLVDLLFTIDKVPKKKLFLKSLRFFFHPLHVNIFKLAKIKQVFSDIKIYVDNRKLDGFLDYFFAGKCQFDDCGDCGYCRSVAERAVYIDSAYKEKADKIFTDIIESLTKGDLFRYF